MFHSLRTRRTSAFDRVVGAMMCLAVISFGYAVLFGGMELVSPAAAVDVIASDTNVTFEVISVEALLPDVAGAIGQLPVFRF